MIEIQQFRKAERWCLNHADLCVFEGGGFSQAPERYSGPGYFNSGDVKSLRSEFHLLVVHSLQYSLPWLHASRPPLERA